MIGFSPALAKLVEPPPSSNTIVERFEVLSGGGDRVPSSPEL